MRYAFMPYHTTITGECPSFEQLDQCSLMLSADQLYILHEVF